MRTEEALKELTRRCDFLTEMFAKQSEQFDELLLRFGQLSNVIETTQQFQANEINDGVGITASLYVLSELLLASSDSNRALVAEATSQALSRPETIANDHMREFLSHLHTMATKPPRVTPEGRRQWLHLVPPSKPTK